MFQLKSLALYCTLLAMLIAHSQAQDATTCKPDTGDRDDDPDDLCKDFQLIRDLIDEEILAELIQSHYQCDAKFRKAVCYYKTSRFDLVIEQLQQSEAYKTLLEELRKAGVDTSDIDSIADIFGCIEVPLLPDSKKCDCKALRGHTFIGDLLAAMPHQEVRNFTSRSYVENHNFALFRQTVMAPEFQGKLRANLMKRDAIRPLRVLRRNGWDIPELLRGAMSILSW